MVFLFRYFFIIFAVIALFSCQQSSTIAEVGHDCDYNDPMKIYVGFSVDECQGLSFRCDPGSRRFQDHCGCGCERLSELPSRPSNVLECTEEMRSAASCREVYAPVCGYYVDDPLFCNHDACRETFANSCFACRTERVRVYMNGSCRTIR